ncbi:MAG: rod shape-determining protein MreC [Acidimicrobiales bacterium]
MLVLTAITFLTLDLRGFGPLTSLQQGARDVLSPVRSRADSIFSPITDRFDSFNSNDDLKRENESLRAELEELKGQALRDETDAANYRKLRGELGLQDDLAIPAVIGRVSYQVPGNFAPNTVEIDRGSSSGLKVNQPVITKAGLVGRLVRVDSDRSTVRLLSHPDSNVAIYIGEQYQMLARGGVGTYTIDAVPSLEADRIPRDDRLQGELVTTAGGPVFPKDIVVGRVASVIPAGEQVTVRIELSVDLSALDFVTVLLYEPPK